MDFYTLILADFYVFGEKQWLDTWHNLGVKFTWLCFDRDLWDLDTIGDLSTLQMSICLGWYLYIHGLSF